jgi:hypothetical protein
MSVFGAAGTIFISPTSVSQASGAQTRKSGDLSLFGSMKAAATARLLYENVFGS